MRLGRKVASEEVRKLQRTGENGSSYSVTLPREFITTLGWQKKQKVTIALQGKTLIIKDWEK